MGSTGAKPKIQILSNPYIIVGCQPRGASFFMRTALRELGLEIGHEEPEKDGVVGFQHLLHSHPWTMKAMKKGRRRPKVWLLQFRHPVPTINSMAAMYFRGDWPPLTGPLNIQYMCRMQKSDTPVMRAMRLYYHLNEQGMKQYKFKTRYQIENVDEAWPRIMEAIGMPGKPMPDVPRDTNSRKDKGKYPNLEWRDIYDVWPDYGMRIARLADCMGYDVGDWQNTELQQWADGQEKGES